MTDTTNSIAMDIHEVLQYLPHRYPFLLIDGVESLVLGESIVAIKNVSINEPFFTGHFPKRPVMPGVLICEAMAQASGILAFKSTNTLPDEKSLYYFIGIDNARFRKVVEPGHQLKIHVNIDKTKRNIWKFKAKAYVGESLVCEADIATAKQDIIA